MSTSDFFTKKKKKVLLEKISIPPSAIFQIRGVIKKFSVFVLAAHSTANKNKLIFFFLYCFTSEQQHSTQYFKKITSVIVILIVNTGTDVVSHCSQTLIITVPVDRAGGR